MALEWLYYEDFKLGGLGRVRHVRNGGQVQIPTPAGNYYVDGFDEETNTVYEFHGCFYHGCKICFKHSREVKRNCYKDRTVSEVYEATERKTEMLRRAGYQVLEKWECEFKEEEKTDAQMKAFLESFELVTTLRTTGRLLRRENWGDYTPCKGQRSRREQILYADVTSLYP